MDRRLALTPESPNLGPDPDDNETESEEEEEEETEGGEEEEEEDNEDDDDDDEEVQAAMSVHARFSRSEPTMPFPAMGEVGEDSEQGGGWNREEMEGLFCPICLEAWSDGGHHYPSCLPCGHLYGMSCIKKWFLQRRSGGKCPQCNVKCSVKDIRRIYGSRVLVTCYETEKRIESLEAKRDLLEKKMLKFESHLNELIDWRKKEETEWLRKEAEWQKREADLCMQLQTEDADWSRKEAEWQKREADLQQQLNLHKEAGLANDIIQGESTEIGHPVDGNCPEPTNALKRRCDRKLL